jgi:hypothetical protein
MYGFTVFYNQFYCEVQKNKIGADWLATAAPVRMTMKLRNPLTELTFPAI